MNSRYYFIILADDISGLRADDNSNPSPLTSRIGDDLFVEEKQTEFNYTEHQHSYKRKNNCELDSGCSLLGTDKSLLISGAYFHIYSSLITVEDERLIEGLCKPIRAAKR